MADNRPLIVGALNIVANPHPPGTYVNLLTHVAGAEVAVWGPDHAKITEPRQQRQDDDWYLGRILVWTEIDKNRPWINKRNNDEASAQEMADVVIPDQLQPNYRSFHYLLVASRHIIMLVDRL